MKKGCPIFTDWTTFFPHTSRMLHVGFSWGGVRGGELPERPGDDEVAGHFLRSTVRQIVDSGQELKFEPLHFFPRRLHVSNGLPLCQLMGHRSTLSIVQKQTLREKFSSNYKIWILQPEHLPSFE